MKDPAAINRKIKPPFGKPAPLRIDDPVVTGFDNGLKVFCINAGEEEVTRIDIVIYAGSAYQSKKLVASSTGKLLKEGTHRLKSSDIARLIDEKGAYLEVAINKDSAIVTLYALSKYLKDLLPVVGEMLLHSNFPEEEFQIHVERQRQEFMTNIEKVRYKAMLEFNCMVFGRGSAYGQELKQEDFGKITRDDIRDFYSKRYLPQNAYVIASGALTTDLVDILDKNFGNGWSGAVSRSNGRLFFKPFQPEKKIILKENALQSAIRIGRPLVEKTHQDYNAFLLLNTILGGYFGSRLMSNLREDKGYTYGVNSFVANYINAGYFSISTEVNVKHTRAALDEIYGEMDRLRKEPVGDEELNLVKNYIYGTFLRTFDGPFALADRFRSVKDFGLGFDFYKKSLDEIRQISAEKLIDIARKYLDPNQMIELVVGRMD